MRPNQKAILREWGGCAAALLSILASVACCAQNSPSARAGAPTPTPLRVNLEVAITGEDGQPANGAEVRVVSPEGELIHRAVTDEAGRLRLRELPLVPGGYRVLAARDRSRGEGFVEVLPEQAGTTLSVVLRLQPLAMANGHPKNYAIVRVFYVTDRGASGRSEPARFYLNDRAPAGRVALGICDVSIPREHRMGELEGPSIWRLEFREDPEKHVVLLSVTPKPDGEFFQELSARVAQSTRREAFVFIHGYNVTFEDAARRTAQISYDLAFEGAPILYSWPSKGAVSQYTVDETNVEWTTPHLKDFLERVSTSSGATTIHLIAHSMGNRALTAALRSIATEERTTPRPRFQHVVLTAPDIDADVFRQIAAAVTRTSGRVTLYASSSDHALSAAKAIAGYPRAGEGGPGIVVVPGVDTIDVSDLDTGLIGHSYHADNRSVLSDIFRLLRDGSPPSQRFGLTVRQLGARTYWVFRP